jgi:hypothetical protein
LALDRSSNFFYSLGAEEYPESAECFAKGLNAILLAYQQETLGDMQYHAGPDDLIFVANQSESAACDYQMIIAGTSLRALAAESQATSADAKKPLAQWARRLETKAWKRKNNPCTLSWQSVWHCWDLNLENRISSVEFPVYCIADILGECQFLGSPLAE